jgi:hypothetical protein
MRCGLSPRHQPSAVRCQDRHEVSGLWTADCGHHFGRKRRPHAGCEALRAGARISAGDLCDVVDQGFDSGIYSAFMVASKNGTSAAQKKLFFRLRRTISDPSTPR